VLLAATVGALASMTFVTTRAEIVTLTKRRIQDLLLELGLRVQSHVHHAVPVVELSKTLVDEALLRPDRKALLQLFVALLEANPYFSWASYSDENGDFTGAYRTEKDGVLPSLTSLRDASASLRPPSGRPRRSHARRVHPAEEGYDPRTDLFYQEAKNAGKRIWVGPYVFHDEGIPGVTCASPRFAADGRLQGIFTVDFDLNVLSRFVSELRFGERGHLRLTSGARSGVSASSAEEDRGGIQRRLITIADVGDPAGVLRGHADTERQLAASGPSSETQFSFEHAGERYLAGYRKVTIDEGVTWIVGAMAPEADFLAVLTRNRRHALAIAGTALGLGLLSTLVITRRISAALLRLAGEMKQVGGFHLTKRAPIPTIFREVSMMDEALTNMKGSLRSFSYFVPKELVRSILASGREATLQGESREMTIFFSDIRGFTSTAETMQPDELVHQMSRYLDEMTQVTVRHGGTVDKFIGDAIMAFWGAPVPTADHAARACEAALDSQRRLAELRSRAETPWLANLHARVGVATGNVLVGNIGSRERFNYTVMGDAVNLASRLESLNKLYGTLILVSEPTYLAARDRIVARPIDVEQVKGKQRGVRVYEPLCLATEDDLNARALALCFEEGLSAYLDRDFARAASSFERAATLRPGDRPSEMLLERCRHHLSSPPPADWNGIHVAVEK
jgi:adenylate cyclase